MAKRDTERAALALSRQAFDLLGAADMGSSLLAYRLAYALQADPDLPNSRDAAYEGVHAPTADLLSDSDRAPKHDPSPARHVFVASDGRRLSISPSDVSHVSGEADGAVVIFKNGASEQVRDPFDDVIARLGLADEATRDQALGGVITTDAARHHLRNLLTIVSALVNQAVDRNELPLEPGRDIGARVAMLNRVSDLLLQPYGHHGDIHELIELVLSDASAGRVRVQGPALAIGPGTATSLALALHELEVHALGFGALREETGQVEVRWELNQLDQPCLWLQWAERDGPSRPLSEGYGKRLIMGTARRLRGEGSLQELPTGLVWSLIAPLAALQS